MSEQTENKTTPAPKPTVEELRAEIKQTRADLGETVQALAAKADVKARAKEQVETAAGSGHRDGYGRTGADPDRRGRRRGGGRIILIVRGRRR